MSVILQLKNGFDHEKKKRATQFSHMGSKIKKGVKDDSNKTAIN